MAEGILVDPQLIRLETERLILRPLKEQDSDGLYQNVKEYDIAKWMIEIPYPYPKEGTIKFIKKAIGSMQKGLSYELAIELRASSEVIGVMSLININKRHRNAELGYWIGKRYWNGGLATEAAMSMLGFGFQELNLERIYAKCFHNNDASRRVLEKIGMKYEGKFRHEILKENKFIDTVHFAIIKEDWEKVK